jgi:hypothetical protein
LGRNVGHFVPVDLKGVEVDAALSALVQVSCVAAHQELASRHVHHAGVKGLSQPLLGITVAWIEFHQLLKTGDGLLPLPCGESRLASSGQIGSGAGLVAGVRNSPERQHS